MYKVEGFTGIDQESLVKHINNFLERRKGTIELVGISYMCNAERMLEERAIVTYKLK